MPLVVVAVLMDAVVLVRLVSSVGPASLVPVVAQVVMVIQVAAGRDSGNRGGVGGRGDRGLGGRYRSISQHGGSIKKKGGAENGETERQNQIRTDMETN